MLEVPRVVAIWEEAEEPFVNSAFWNQGTHPQTPHPAGTFGDLVHPALSGVAFLTGGADSQFVLLPTGPIRIKEPMVNPNLRQEFSIRGVATAPFAGAICTGRVFILDRETWSDDQWLDFSSGMSLQQFVLTYDHQGVRVYTRLASA